MTLIAATRGSDYALLGADLRCSGPAASADLGGKLVWTGGGWATASGHAPARLVQVALHLAAGKTDGSPRRFFPTFRNALAWADRELADGAGAGFADPILASWSDGGPALHGMQEDGMVVEYGVGFVGFAYLDAEDGEVAARHEDRIRDADGLGAAVQAIAGAFADVAGRQPLVSDHALFASLSGDGGRQTWFGRASALASLEPSELMERAQRFDGTTHLQEAV